MRRSTLGQYLQIQRVALGITPADLARAIGASKSTVCRLEVGTTAPSAALLARVCRALKLTDAERLEALERAGEGRGPRR